MRRIFILLTCMVMLLTIFPAAGEETSLKEGTAAPQSTESAPEFADFSARFPEHFNTESAKPLITETSYQSADISIEISVSRVDKTDVYVADIYVRTVKNFMRAFGGNKWHSKMEKVKTIAENSGALLALTGDNGHNFSSGWVFGNGVLLRKTSNKTRDLCILYKNGEMVTIKGSKIDNNQIAADKDLIWQSFLFGPALLDENGGAVTSFTSSLKVANPRAAIGYYEPGHYCLVQVDGRGTKSAVQSGGKNSGMTFSQLSAFMASLGCKAAYNLDGGQSALMWFNGSVISTPYKGGRNIGDIVIIKESEE